MCAPVHEQTRKYIVNFDFNLEDKRRQTRVKIVHTTKKLMPHLDGGSIIVDNWVGDGHGVGGRNSHGVVSVHCER